MAVPVFIGDEWTATGWRLAGVRVMVPEPKAPAVRAAFEDACAASPVLVLISAPFARLLDFGRLTEARRWLDPPVLVVGDAAGSDGPDDVADAIRQRMGVAR